MNKSTTSIVTETPFGGGRTHGNAEQNKRWAAWRLGANAFQNAVRDGFHVVPVCSGTEVTHFTTEQQHGELLAGGSARGLQPNALCLYEDLAQSTPIEGGGHRVVF
jgi:hypothetical protein